MTASKLDIQVRRAPADSELTDHPEHCWVDPRLLASLGLTGRPQVRIERDDQVALYTVSAVVDQDRGDIVRIGPTGRKRLDGPDTFDGRVDPLVTRSELDDEHAAGEGEFVERLSGDTTQRNLIALAPHGGLIEACTDHQAELVASTLGVSAWRCKGWRPGGGAKERWHITSVDIDPASFPRLQTIAGRRFRQAVSFHGFGGSGVVIGGSAPDDLKHTVRCAIDDALGDAGIDVRIATANDPLGGDDPGNIVNRLTVRRKHGIQIEQDDDVRRDHWREIAEAVSGVYGRILATSRS
jgi:phage replication-related protein YjqB (UPF0714/DUF867 family)